MLRIIILLLSIIFTSVAGAKMVTLSLPTPKIEKAVYLDEAIQKRRSVRRFSAKALTDYQISKLLWAAQGITDTHNDFRAAPSAGALYPLELYLIKNNGVWHYLVRNHSIEQINEKDLRSSLANAALEQSCVAQAPIDIVIAADYNRVTKKYGERGIRYTHIEVGHTTENLVLEAAALGLSSITIGAFNDDKVSNLLNLPHNETPLYIIPVGYQ